LRLHGLMPPTASSPTLPQTLDDAVAGRPARLFDLLARGSGLPGPRPHLALADVFAQACRGRGAAADATILRMARLSADEAPGATALEFLPVCGVAALGARAAADATVRARFVDELHAHADDTRFRVRDAVVDALARVGGAVGERLALDLDSWMDGYFHAAAVVRGVGREAWLSAMREAGPAIARLDDAFTLAGDAPRAAARYPGYKALREALTETPVALAARFGVPVFDALLRGPADDRTRRESLERLAESTRLAGRYSSEVERVRRALAASRPSPRNPDHDVGPTRDRSRDRRLRGRGPK